MLCPSSSSTTPTTASVSSGPGNFTPSGHRPSLHFARRGSDIPGACSGEAGTEKSPVGRLSGGQNSDRTIDQSAPCSLRPASCALPARSPTESQWPKSAPAAGLYCLAYRQDTPNSYLRHLEQGHLERRGKQRACIAVPNRCVMTFQLFSCVCASGSAHMHVHAARGGCHCRSRVGAAESVLEALLLTLPLLNARQCTT